MKRVPLPIEAELERTGNCMNCKPGKHIQKVAAVLMACAEKEGIDIINRASHIRADLRCEGVMKSGILKVRYCGMYGTVELFDADGELLEEGTIHNSAH